MTFGYSILEGVGSALMIPPIYILVTVLFSDLATRARYFGVISGAAGLGAAAGPLIGGFVTTVFGWRASFVLQVLVIATIIWLARGLTDPPESGPRPRFDVVGAVLSAAGLFFVVLGILLTRSYGWLASREDFTVGGTVVIPKGGISPIWIFLVIGAAILAWFFLHLRATERAGREPLLHLRLFRNRTANLGLGYADDPVARAAGVLLHDLGVPPGGARLHRDRHRAPADAGHDRHPGLLRPGRAAGRPSTAAMARRRRFPRAPPSAWACCWPWCGSTRPSGPSCPDCS